MSEIIEELALYSGERKSLSVHDQWRIAKEIERMKYAMKRSIVALREHGNIKYAIKELESALPTKDANK
jgi:hypothetical protein